VKLIKTSDFQQKIFSGFKYIEKVEDVKARVGSKLKFQLLIWTSVGNRMKSLALF
jgi:hypothetical protein